MRFKKPKATVKSKTKPERSNWKLPIISEEQSKGRSILVCRDEGPVLNGNDERAPNLCCGTCGVPLVVGLPASTVINVVVQCKGCGSLNDLADARAVN
jgi:hypothetical protein